MAEVTVKAEVSCECMVAHLCTAKQTRSDINRYSPLDLETQENIERTFKSDCKDIIDHGDEFNDVSEFI